MPAKPAPACSRERSACPLSAYACSSSGSGMGAAPMKAASKVFCCASVGRMNQSGISESAWRARVIQQLVGLNPLLLLFLYSSFDYLLGVHLSNLLDDIKERALPYIINSLFDAVFTIMGIVIGSSFSARLDLRSIIGTIITSSLSLGVSSGFSIYEAEIL
jgi:hypothetical protein